MRHFVIIISLFVLTAPAMGQLRFGGGAHAGGAIQSYSIGYDLKAQGYKVNRELNVDPYGFGFAVGGDMTLSFSRYFHGRITLDYMRFGASTSKITDQLTQIIREAGFTVAPGDIEANGGGLSFFDASIVFVGVLPTGSIVSPYALVGPAMCYHSTVDLTMKIGPYTENASYASEWSVGFTYGIGAQFAIARQTALFVEVRDVLNYLSGKSSGHSTFTLGASYGI